MTLPSTPLLEGEPPAEVGRGECVTSRADWEAPPPLKTNKNDAEPGAAALLCTRKVSRRNAQCCSGGYGGRERGGRGAFKGVKCLAAVFGRLAAGFGKRRGVMRQRSGAVFGAWCLESIASPIPRGQSKMALYAKTLHYGNSVRLRASVRLSSGEKREMVYTWYAFSRL